MSLEIRKKGNKNFQHISPNYSDYGANDLTIIFEGNTVKLRSFTGRVIFDKAGYDLANISIYDDSTSGNKEVFPNIQSLKQRLINLGYPFNGGSEDVVLNTVEWSAITGDPTTSASLVAYIESETGTINGGTP
mgnify:FL=1|tara:strand:+ start:3887 stop:4285 length:399 start_codon:yes stop_codon:yes gene_type:complete